MLVAVVVVGLQRQLLAVLRDELGQIDGLVVVRGFGGGHQARPRHMIANGFALGGRELGGHGFIGEQAEHRLLMGQFGAEAVHHADRAFAIGLHQRMAQVEADQKLLHAEPAVDQVDFEDALAQNAVAIFQLFRRDDLHLIAFVAEEIAEQLVFAVAGVVGRAELDDRDVGLLAAAELLVGFQQRLQAGACGCRRASR